MKIYSPSKGFVEQASEDRPHGTYVAWNLTERAARDVADWARMVGVPNPIHPLDMHATIMYSPEGELPCTQHGNFPLNMPVSLNVHNFPRTQILGKAGSPGALVTVFDSALLHARHHYWEEEGLRHSFPEFIPHVTLSYDASSIPRDVVYRMMCNPCPLPFDFDVEKITYCKD